MSMCRCATKSRLPERHRREDEQTEALGILVPLERARRVLVGGRPPNVCSCNVEII